MRPPEQAAYSSDNCPSFCTIIVPPNTSFFALFLDIWGNRDFNSFVTFKLMIDPKIYSDGNAEAIKLGVRLVPIRSIR